MADYIKFNPDELPAIIMDNAFDSIICYLPVADPADEIIDFKVIYLNTTALNILGGSKEDHVGKSLLNLFPYSTRNGLFNDMKKTFHTGERNENVYYFDSYLGKGWSQNSMVRYDNIIVVYFRNVTEKKLLENELQKRNEELQVLMTEIHHRVKNNLQIISSILNLQKKAIKDPAFSEAIEVCTQRIRTMAIIHHRIYEDKSYHLVNLPDFIYEIVSSLNQVYSDIEKEINIVYDIEDIVLDIDGVIKVGLITNELLTNIYKHAFPDKKQGEVFIEARKKEKEFQLRISDNGRGLPDNFSYEETESVGMVIIKALTEQMEARVEVIKHPGTSFLITFPFVEPA
jgi:two-component sensor histidine kinase